MHEAKLGMVIRRLDSINKKFEDRFNSIDKNFGDFNTKFKEFNKMLSSKINKLEKNPVN